MTSGVQGATVSIQHHAVTDSQSDRQTDREMESSAYVRARRIALSADKTLCTLILARIYVYADASLPTERHSLSVGLSQQ